MNHKSSANYNYESNRRNLDRRNDYLRKFDGGNDRKRRRSSQSHHHGDKCKHRDWPAEKYSLRQCGNSGSSGANNSFRDKGRRNFDNNERIRSIDNGRPNSKVRRCAEDVYQRKSSNPREINDVKKVESNSASATSSSGGPLLESAGTSRSTTASTEFKSMEKKCCPRDTSIDNVTNDDEKIENTDDSQHQVETTVEAHQHQDRNELSTMDRLGKLSEKRLRESNAVRLPTADDFYFAAEKERYYRNMYKLIVTARQEIHLLEDKLNETRKKLESRCAVTCPSCSVNFSTESNRFLPKYLKVLRSTNRVELQFNDINHLKEWLIMNNLDRDAEGVPTYFEKENTNLMKKVL